MFLLKTWKRQGSVGCMLLRGGNSNAPCASQQLGTQPVFNQAKLIVELLVAPLFVLSLSPAVWSTFLPGNWFQVSVIFQGQGHGWIMLNHGENKLAAGQIFLSQLKNDITRQ